MKRFLPLIRVLVGAGVGVVAIKANQRYGMAVDQDALTAAIMLALAASNTRNEPETPPRQSPPKI